MIWEELRSVSRGRTGVADGIVPPVVFVATDAVWGVSVAAWLGMASAVLIVVARLAQGRPIRFAIAGLAAAGLASGLALRSDDARDYFLPGVITSALTVVLIVVSVVVKRPFVAWTSWIARGWPMEWYWHPQVRPAYSLCSWLWAVFFGVRTLIQWWLFLTDQVVALGLVRVLTGWPALFVLLIATYFVGRRKLEALAGPSVDEFTAGTPPPWVGQQNGF